MVDHYFSKKPTSALRIKPIELNLLDMDFTFDTASGVFAVGKLDRGTELLIKSIDSKGGKLLDLGCGYGAVGVTLSVFFDEVYMVDVNERAVAVSKRNKKRNKCKNCIVLQSDGFSAVEGKKFDVIATNPPTHAGKKLIFSWIEQIKSYLAPKGAFYLVCKTKLGAKSYEAKIQEEFGNCETIKKGSGYRVFRAINL
ncbi:class I SAM-dependent methyltransferase [Candidatus Woesearchaeota archaeon]|jgi:16S rRNA (guanine1207-N2)-methyltransferase|nr:class I SAM-dependent methyltransferase [Candidatus Woesearchaeota archaeon]MBT7062934.1 class I SAM-dependent methyltransferase [Candidatus Woesearchaeota archaeon]MBT7402642.1 class I SAM-dependent methyltransferase [Candidatus Woesearchaeota archaeon]